MQITSPIIDQWPQLRSALPAGFDLEATARERGAFTRARGVKDAESLLRLALGYGACGMSLRECSAWAEASGIASLSDPALLKRLSKAADWLGDLLQAMLAEGNREAAGKWAGLRLRALDATSICAPGADRTTWRLHAGYDLASGQVDHIALTDGRGAESLKRFNFRPGEIVLADRGYARPRDLRPVLEAGAHLIVRVGWNSLRLCTADGAPVDLFAQFKKLRTTEGETMVYVDEGKGAPDELLPLRLVMRRKTRQQAADAQRRLLKEAKKRGKMSDPRSLEAAKYVLLLTSLPADTFPTSEVLTLYRFRWQIELLFKRFKSLAGLDSLPAKNPDLARAWIYARLIAAVLAERLAGNHLPDSPPSAPRNQKRNSVKVARRKDGARRNPRRRSRRAALAKNNQPLHASTPIPM